MKIYKISQNVNNNYDTYDSAIVCAENEEEAKTISPDNFYPYDEKTKTFHWWTNQGTKNEQYEPENICNSWCSRIEQVDVEYIGEAKKGMKKGVILASFNAG